MLVFKRGQKLNLVNYYSNNFYKGIMKKSNNNNKKFCHYFKIISMLIILQVILINATVGQSLLSASGTEIVNTSGEPVYLKGVNLGNWLLQEGWMISWDGNTPGTQSEMKKILYDRGFSAAEIDAFYESWRNNFITQSDIEFIASKGMNCIRIPLHYELFLSSTLRAARAEVAYGTRTYASYKTLLSNSLSTIGTDYTTPGYQKIDDLLSWCSANGIYVILDMHAVPGSQGTDEHIADCIGTPNDLWYSSVNQDVLNALWDNISNRYKNNSTVAMYDLINEPNDIPSEATMQSVYQRLISTIRNNGDDHLLMIEGNGWGNDYDGVTPDQFSPRTNLVYSIHRYDFDAWVCPTDVDAYDPYGNPNQIQYLGSANAFRNAYNVPIFCGETGLRNHTWMAENTASLAQLGIGWTIWSYKWHTGMSYDYGFGNIPGIYPVEIYSNTDMSTVLENIKYSNMVANTNQAFWDALATPDSPEDPGTGDYTKIPGTIEAENYVSMSGIQTESCSEGGENVGWIDAGDWMMYDIDVPTSGNYTVNYRVASLSGGGQIQLEQAGGGNIYGIIDVPKTDGWQSWETISHTIELSAGEQTIAIVANSGGFNINSFSFESSDTGESFSQKIEAEDYTNMSGVQTENTTDTDGGQNVGWIDSVDWMIWDVDLPTTGTYTIEYRVASQNGGGSIQFEKAGGTEVYGTIDVPNTGGWQTWTTISHTVTLNAGAQQIAIYAQSGGFNINWLQITQGLKSGEMTSSKLTIINDKSFRIFPNPAEDFITIQQSNGSEINSVEIYTLSGQSLLKKQVKTSSEIKLNVADLLSGVYLLKVNSKNGEILDKFIKK